jgi:hypothetical protein
VPDINIGIVGEGKTAIVGEGIIADEDASWAKVTDASR